jgi:trk system potassium uptake protein
METDVLVIEGDACDVATSSRATPTAPTCSSRPPTRTTTTSSPASSPRSSSGCKRAISRVNTPKNVEIFETLGIEPVSSTRLISELLENEFSVGELIHLTSLKGGRVQLVELRIPDGPRPRSPAGCSR